MAEEEIKEGGGGQKDIIEMIEKGEYKLHDKLGEGSYGEVFLAEKIKSHEPFAIKVMQLSSKQQLRNFIKERFFSTFFGNVHNNILQACDVYVINDEKKDTDIVYHISMEFPPSSSLEKEKTKEEEEEEEENEERYGVLVLEPMDFDLMDYIISKGRLPEEESRLIFKEICKAMKCCHDNQVAHLDLKPDNILLKIAGESDHSIQSLKVCDFGFAVQWSTLISLANQNSLPPHFRILFGTKEYQSPETFKNKLPYRSYHLLDKVDIWSLGVTLFVMLTGLFPFVEKNGILYTVGLDEVAKYCSMHPSYYLSHPSPPPSSSSNHPSPCKYEDTAVHLVERMLNTNPAMRPSIGEVLNHPWLADKETANQKRGGNKKKNNNKKNQKNRLSFLRNFSDKCFELENDSFESEDDRDDDDVMIDDDDDLHINKKKKKKKITDRIFDMYNKLLNTSQYNNNNNNNNNK